MLKEVSLNITVSTSVNVCLSCSKPIIEKDNHYESILKALGSPHDQSQKAIGYINRLKKIGSADFFSEVDRILTDWVNNPSLDSSLTFARLFKASNRPKVGFCLSGKQEDLIVAGNI